MKWLILVFVCMVSLNSAHASLWGKCKKWLVASDPYQFEQVSQAWLEKYAGSLRIKKAWGKAMDDELEDLQVAEDELARRVKFGGENP